MSQSSAAGICGLAHALAAARRGKRVVVIDRDAQANGASIRNFGFITVTGQQGGKCWRRAMRSVKVWLEVAEAAKIPILQRGLLMIARRPEARAVIEAFLETEMGAECRLVESRKLSNYGSDLRTGEFAGALHSPHEARVESRKAIPQLAAWLSERFGVTFVRETAVHAASPPRLETSRGPIEAEAIIVSPGDDFACLHADRLAQYGLTRCKLHMMRVRPQGFDERLPAIMSDLGMIRYLGYAELPAAQALRARLEAEQREHIGAGVHLIAVRSADGTLVVGDSHHYAATPDPFAPAADLYRRPPNRFAAEFLGRANLLPVVVEGDVRKEGLVAVRAGDDRLVVACDGAPSGARRLLCVRPQHLTLTAEQGYANRIGGRLRDVLWQGELTHLVAEVGDTVMRIVATRLPSLPERGAPLDLFFAPADASLIPEEAGV